MANLLVVEDDDDVRDLTVTVLREDGHRVLQAAAHQGDREVVAWLLARGAAVNARGPGRRTAAHLAAERNTGPATLALLVEHGADLSARDADGHTPLDVARLNGKGRLVEWIGRVTLGHPGV